MRKRHYLLEIVSDHLPFKRPRAAVAGGVQAHESQHAQA